MIHVIIDGYNLIRQVPILMRHESESLETARTALIKILSQYKKIKRHKITVVFDGILNLSEFASEYQESGITVSFSPAGKSADDVIKEMSQREGARALIVTSDRSIQNFALRYGAGVLESPEFYAKLSFAELVDGSCDLVESTEAKPAHKRWTTFKRGNPRKLPKRERGQKKRIEKL